MTEPTPNRGRGRRRDRRRLRRAHDRRLSREPRAPGRRHRHGRRQGRPPPEGDTYRSSRPGWTRSSTTRVAAGMLDFDTAYRRAASAPVVMLCLPTPSGLDGELDLGALERAASELRPIVQSGTVVVTKSTVPVGTHRRLGAWLQRDDVEVAANPEFLREGTAVSDFLAPDRIVIGADDPIALEAVATLYEGIDAPIQRIDPTLGPSWSSRRRTRSSPRSSRSSTRSHGCAKRSVATSLRSCTASDPTTGSVTRFFPARARVGWFLLPEGHPRARRARVPRGPRPAGHRLGQREQHRSVRSCRRLDRRALCRRHRVGGASPCGASHSRPTPTTPVTHLRSRSSSDSSAGAPSSSPTTRPSTPRP